jgi:uncharacterized protein YndB with AHSA1/START domain
MTRKAEVTLPNEEQILITREFEAPKRFVYAAYTTPELVKRWWSGRRGEMTVAEIDLRVGGRWRYAMIANEGFEVAFNGEFREIVPEARILTTEVFEGAPGGEPALTTASFEEAEGRTTLTLLCDYGSKAVRDMVIDSGMEGGMQEGMDLLEEVAAELAAE